MSYDPALERLATAALEQIAPDMVVGLGSGRASHAFVRALGEAVASGLSVRGVPTSHSSAQLAESLGIPLVSLNTVPYVDVAVDGADEVDPQGRMIKGYGAALVRERIVATAARRFIILIGKEKLVDTLGQRGRVPVEVLPFAWSWCQRELQRLGISSILREQADEPLATDNGNFILDCLVTPLAAAVQWHAMVKAIPGVIDTGLFLQPPDEVLVARGENCERLSYSSLVP